MIKQETIFEARDNICNKEADDKSDKQVEVADTCSGVLLFCSPFLSFPLYLLSPFPSFPLYQGKELVWVLVLTVNQPVSSSNVTVLVVTFIRSSSQAGFFLVRVTISDRYLILSSTLSSTLSTLSSTLYPFFS